MPLTKLQLQIALSLILVCTPTRKMTSFSTCGKLWAKAAIGSVACIDYGGGLPKLKSLTIPIVTPV